MEGVHLTLFSEDPKIREALAVELTADRFVSRNKLKKASRMQKKAGGKDGKEIKIIIKSTAASGRFTRKEMEGLCNGGNTSIARVKRVLLEIANRLEINVEGIDMEEDLNTKSWNGSKLCILLGSTEDARCMMKELPFYLEGAATKLEAVGFDKEPDSEAAGQRGTSDAAQRQEESEGEWLEFTDLERITMEAASPSSQEDMQLVSELSAVIEDAASLNEAGTSEPIKLYDENVRNLLYRRSCQYTQSGLVDASVLEADLVERVKSFAKRYPNSRTAQACKAVEGCTPDAIAEAIRSTCQQARRELLQEAMTGWSDASREWFMQQIEEAKKEKVETYTASAGNEVTSFISMTLLGISSVYVNHEEKLKKKFEEIGLIVDSVQESKAIMWKAPYRPEIASAEEIPV
ncbi:hypothetical protein GUITHDRAFT_112404, partial [Guillardia theta CCMP2712]